jgi:hypothetical protein
MACLGNGGRAIPRRTRNTRTVQSGHDLLPSWKLNPTVQTNMIFPLVSGYVRTGLGQVP